MRLLPRGYPYWSDVWIRAAWRVQVRDGSARLLDPDDRIHQAGNEADCLARGERLAPSAGRSRAVILLHGLARSRRSMQHLGRRFAGRGWAVAEAGYASLTLPLEDHVAAVRRIRAGLAADGATEISLIGHSLGGLIARGVMAEAGPPGRLVLLGVPNQGSILAERLSVLSAYRHLFGPCGQAVRPDRVRPLPVPPVPILNIAGGTGGRGWNPLLPGDNDGTVTVAETRLAAAGTRFRRIAALHYRLPVDRRAIAAALDFFDPPLA